MVRSGWPTPIERDLTSSLSATDRLGLHAFRRVLSRRPALYSTITSLLVRELRNGQYGAAQVHLQKVVNHKSTAFADRGNGGRKAARM